MEGGREKGRGRGGQWMRRVIEGKREKGRNGMVAIWWNEDEEKQKDGGEGER